MRDSQAFEALRQAGFAIYARQRIWQLDRATWRAIQLLPPGSRLPTEDLISVRSLYNNLVPGLVQQVEPFPAERLRGMVYRQGDDLLAYVEFKYGRRGIWVQPFVHPDAEQVAESAGRICSTTCPTALLVRCTSVCALTSPGWSQPSKNLGAAARPTPGGDGQPAGASRKRRCARLPCRRWKAGSPSQPLRSAAPRVRSSKDRGERLTL